jgi:serine/threonine protein kinase
MNERSIFIAALEKDDPAERSVYLDKACGDAALRQRIERLLAAHAAAGGIIDRPVGPDTQPPTGPFQPILERAGTVVGLYKLLQQIGEGGMGTVYMAEQSHPVKRKVALKIIKPGMDTRHIMARFQAERQALALMDHRNIAKVLDAGTTADGRPYFVMELVKGVPITRYCDEHHLTPRERLELFIPVCQTIQHAHHKGIIHRDIKPSNVLVCIYNGKPVHKVIDFGVAKATGPKLTEQTLFTEFGAIVGTVEYMSPEQAQLDQLDIDTRSDIYSLGVLLYELLTGTTPLERKRLKQVAVLELLRLVREEEAPRPSTRLSTVEALPSIAANRGTERKKLSALMRGELDWIMLKALEKDRERRYEAANSLARDIEHYLHDEAVLACPPTAGYRLRKFARRHPVVLATAALVVALVIGTAVAWWQAVRATRAEAAAMVAAEAEKEAKESALKREESALKREGETKAVLEFVENKVIAAARPKGQEGGQGYDVKLADAIQAALPFVEKGFPAQPLIEARLRRTMGLSFLYLGHAQTSREQFEAAHQLYTRHLGPDHPDTLWSIYTVGCIHALMIPKSSDGTKEANLAMDWLKKAVAAGFKEAGQFKTDTDLDALRQREDFKKLVAELEAASNDKK